MSFLSIRTEGGVLPADLLRRVALLDPDLPGLTPAEYGLAPGERLADAIVRSWNRLLPIWERFTADEDYVERGPGESTQQWSRWLLEELGYSELVAAEPVVIDERPYPVSHRASGVAVHLVGTRTDLDAGGATGRAPHAMVQEFLNRDHDHLWAMVTNGLRLRVLRDSSSLTRQAYCEFDLDAMFAGQHYADFAVCWLITHQTRFAPRSGGDEDTSAACWLQQWSDQAAAEGVRALDALRIGVEAAMESLGSGLVDPRNGALRARLQHGELSIDGFREQLLRLVYRLLFLLVAEARGLLHDEGATPAEQILRYRESYSLERLVRLAARQRGSLHGDLWQGLQVVFAAFVGPGAAPLGLAGLGSFLWSPDAAPDIDEAEISNRALLDAVHHLTYFELEGVKRRVDYKHLGPEELGGVYESLLESHLEVDLAGHRVHLARAAGNERKTTGSYYTPASLIRVLLESALDPVLDEAEAGDDPEAALLALKVLDPAVGSGHFLIAAANRIAARLASVRARSGEPSPVEVRHVLREVIARCVYGVDVNPLSVELCKVSLWIEASEPGKPFTFLENHIVCGNSLLGTTPALLAGGVPDEAFSALTGDDKTVAASWKKRNKQERVGQGSLFTQDVDAGRRELAAELAALETLPQDDVDDLAALDARYRALVAGAAARCSKLEADAWCAAFVVPKVADAPRVTTDVVRRCGTAPDTVAADVLASIDEAQREYRFLHLHVAFPAVFPPPPPGAGAENEKTGWSGGFDVVLGNPPWDKVEFKEKEFFAARRPDIAALAGDRRKQVIRRLAEEDPAVHRAYVRASRANERIRLLLAGSGRFPLCGRGKVNTYAVFAELMRNAIAPRGQVGVIVPTGIATDDTTKHFFGDLVEHKSLVSLYDFENRRAIFPGIHRSTKFCLLTLSGARRPAADAEFVFFALGVEDLDAAERRFTLSAEDFALLNPNTRTCPVFRSKRDAELTKAIYRRVPVLVKEGDPNGNPWGVSFKQGLFNMTSDSHLFRTREELESDGWELQGNHFVRGDEEYLPLYEAKMVHHFDHRWATFENGEIRDTTLAEHQNPCFVSQPQYWVQGALAVDRSEGGNGLAAWRDIARSTDERTFIATAIPLVAPGNKLPLFNPRERVMELVASCSSLVTDFVVRQKVGGSTLNFFYVRQFPILGPPIFAALPVVGAIVLELTYTAWDLEAFARDVGFEGPPFRWDPERRALLRAELDALMFRLYGIERDDVDYILDTFPIVKRKDEAEFGEFRTKRLILERFDAMADADAARREYVPALDPPPAHPSLCHPESTRPDWARRTR